MAELKTKPTQASVKEFLNQIPDKERRDDCIAVAKIMEEVSGDKPKMWGPSIVGFGSVHYVYDSGREGDMPVLGFSPRKPALVLYGVARTAEAMLPKLGKCTTGKGCLYIKKLADVDQKVLEKMITFAAKTNAKKQPKAK